MSSQFPVMHLSPAAIDETLKSLRAELAQLQARNSALKVALKKVREDCFDDSDWAKIIDAALKAQP